MGTEIHGAARLKIKESDRLQATADLLNRLGGQVTILEDGLRIQPVERPTGIEPVQVTNESIVYNFS